MRTSTDFGMVWWAAATAALGIFVPAQGEAAAVWDAHEEPLFIAAIQDAIVYTMTGEASPTRSTSFGRDCGLRAARLSTPASSRTGSTRRYLFLPTRRCGFT